MKLALAGRRAPGLRGRLLGRRVIEVVISEVSEPGVLLVASSKEGVTVRSVPTDRDARPDEQRRDASATRDLDHAVDATFGAVPGGGEQPADSRGFAVW